MRSKLWLAAVPALVLGLAACDDQTAKNDTGPNSTSTAERPATAPTPPTGAPGQTAPGTTGGAPSATSPSTAPAPGTTAPSGTTNSQ